eukprot:g7014.t1
MGSNVKSNPPTQGFGEPKGARAYSHNQDDPGIIPRALSRVFERLQKKTTASLDGGSPSNLSAKVTVSLLQIYNESVQDLLTPTAPFSGDNAGLHVREDPSVGFFVDGLREYTVCSHQEAAALINLGLQQRTTAQTMKNDISSRSHTVLTVKLEQRGGTELPSFVSAEDVVSIAGRYAGSSARSKLVLVDLAGSERGRRSSIYLHQESGPERLREAGFINQSLSALGNVVAALGQAELNRPHIPFRDSKLTRILADSLGGNANAALLATVGPAPQNQAESLSTLVFASRCMRVRNSPARLEESDHMETTLRLQAQLSSMKREFCRREALQQSRYETVVTRLAQELEHARSHATSARASRDSPDRETPPPDPPSKAQVKAPPATFTATRSRGKAEYASTNIPDGAVGSAAAWDESKCRAVAGSSAGGQTDGTESSDGGADGDGDGNGSGGLAVSARGDLLLETTSARGAEDVTASGRAAATMPERQEVAARVGDEVSGSLAWEMLGDALRALEGVWHTGAEVLRQAKQADGATSQNPSGQLGYHAPTDEGNTTTAEEELSRLKKVQVMQRLAKSRTLCEAQWTEARSVLATALRDKARMEDLLQTEVLERRRQESNVRRLRGALQHLLADGDNLDCVAPHPNPNNGPGGRLGRETKLESTYCCGGSSVDTPAESLRDSLALEGDSQGGFEHADRVGRGAVALGVGVGPDHVAGSAVFGE